MATHKNILRGCNNLHENIILFFFFREYSRLAPPSRYGVSSHSLSRYARFRVRSIMSRSPEATATREYEVYSPTTQELYVFNRFGQHITTRNILTGETSYQFTYNQFTSSGKLSSVTDAAGNKVFLLRDHAQQVNSIENTKGQKCRLRMSRTKLLSEVNTPDNYNITFDYYSGPSGLLRSKLDSAGRGYVYTYDEFGRLIGAVTPTGKLIRLAFDLSARGATVMVYNDDSQPLSMLIKGTSVDTKLGKFFYEQKNNRFSDLRLLHSFERRCFLCEKHEVPRIRPVYW